MKTSNTNLDQLRVRVTALSQEGKGIDEIIKELFDQPQAGVVQPDGQQYTLLVASDQKTYQMRDANGKVLDEKPLENHVLFMLQQLAVSQFSELLLSTKIEEFESKVKEFDEVNLKLDDRTVEREQEGRSLDLWTRIIFFVAKLAGETAIKIRNDIHTPQQYAVSSMAQHAQKADLRLIDSVNDSNRLTSPIEIIIGGYSHTGKTVLSVLMEKAFREAGFNNIELMNAEETPRIRQEILQRLTEQGSGKSDSPEFFNKKIRISEAYSSQASKPMLDLTASPHQVKES